MRVYLLPDVSGTPFCLPFASPSRSWKTSGTLLSWCQASPQHIMVLLGRFSAALGLLLRQSCSLCARPACLTLSRVLVRASPGLSDALRSSPLALLGSPAISGPPPGRSRTPPGLSRAAPRLSRALPGLLRAEPGWLPPGLSRGLPPGARPASCHENYAKILRIAKHACSLHT